MDDIGTLGLQNWGRYYRSPPLKGSLSLQLISNAGERVTMPFLSGGQDSSCHHRECVIPDTFSSKSCSLPPKSIIDFSPLPINYSRDIWYHNNGENGRFHHAFQESHHQHLSSYATLLSESSPASAGTSTHVLQTLQPLVHPKAETAEINVDYNVPHLDIIPSKKRSKCHGSSLKEPKQKRAKKAIAPREESTKTVARKRSSCKNLDMVINGIDLHLSGIPTPLCTCTGYPHMCYRWGAGGWQSACCTTSISEYPLPMSTKRKGVRIAGRKMSQGAFKKVLEKLAGEGQDFSSPIDLKLFWAKHGTNKFVTIR